MSCKVELPPGTSQEQAEQILKETPIIFAEEEVGYLRKVVIWKHWFKGKECFHIQQFYKLPEDEHGEWKFGKAMPVTYETIDFLIEGLTKMKAYMEGGN